QLVFHSLGGIVKIIVNNLPVGLGEPYFDKVDALLARVVHPAQLVNC
ncbi:MAG TPA: chorismate synthase, partial [Acholeplasmataceae bacterium]|nr:chorismate synthase [Acholeplasmataceae bacterium]